MSKALIAMSGGVDSSMAASLMQEKGYECIGVTMRLYDNADVVGKSEKTCCSLDDCEDARSVARRLGIPYYVYDFQKDFRSTVMEKFVCAYCKGETPNPCIDCNRYMKFEGLYERATQLDCDKIVTGHYARVCHNEETGRYELKKALDATKDQSYVLYALTQDQLAHTEFPLGEYTKVQIRQMAEERGFVNARKKDSQDICFVPDGHYQQFIEQYLGKKLPEGNFVDESGKVLGRHKGIIYYTIGQRKGLGIAAGSPIFVKEIRPETNEVVIGSNESLFSDHLEAEDFNWISVKEPAPGEEVPCTAKVRYRHTEQPAVARVLENGKVQVVFKEKQRAITKGQAVVLYEGERVLGGGTICGTTA